MRGKGSGCEGEGIWMWGGRDGETPGVGVTF